MELYTVKKSDGEILQRSFSSYVMGVDVGGTNTNVGIAGIEGNKPFLLFSLNFKTKELDSLIPAIKQTLEYSKKEHGIIVGVACIGAAGVVSDSKEHVELTNINWNISTREIIENTSLNEIFMINDFQAIGYGINLLDINNANDLYVVKLKDVRSKSTKAVIGAGTGLGKSILTFDESIKAYVPLASEGGHSEFPVQDDFEIGLAAQIKEKMGIDEPISYEEVLSGRGLENIYYYLRQKQGYDHTNYSKEIDESDDKAEVISRYRTIDKTCKETFRLFAKFYGRCAKNFVLESMALGGLYIAGGIAAKNKEIFKSKDFFEEFENAYRRNDILKEIPVYVIINYDVSLYGACFAAMLQSQK